MFRKLIAVFREGVFPQIPSGLTIPTLELEKRVRYDFLL